MSVRKEWLAVIAATVLLLAGVIIATRTLGTSIEPVGVGARAPDFQAKTIDGTKQVKTLRDYRGKVVLLNFWATWCGPCKVEMPSMEALHRAYGDKGLAIVAVSQDDDAADEKLRSYAQDLGLTFEILYDSTHVMERSYLVVGYPTTFVIGRDGKIRRKWSGADDWNSPANRALVRDLLGLPEEETASAEPAAR